MNEDAKLGFGSHCAKEISKEVTTHSHILPIYATSSFAFDSIDQGIEIFSGAQEGHVYSRYGNPTVDTVAQKIANLEDWNLDHKSHAIMFSSGMSAIHTLFLSLLSPGDTILTQANLYGGTTEMINKIFKPLGIEVLFVKLKDLNQVENCLKSKQKIRLIYFETPSNPTLECVDMENLNFLAKKYGVKTVADNTFATPYLQQPFQFGTDFIIHSTTKFLNGHGNSIAGVGLGLDRHFMQEVVWEKMKLAGTNCNPFDAWLVNNGLKTLHVRMDRHSANAIKLASFLEHHPTVAKINYIGLPSHPDHQVAKKQMRQFGGMLSFELKGGIEAGKAMMNRIKMCTLAPTLGDVDTLILHPASMSHVKIPKKIRLENGITDGLVRVSVGIEDIEDIIGDIGGAMES